MAGIQPVGVLLQRGSHHRCEYHLALWISLYYKRGTAFDLTGLNRLDFPKELKWYSRSAEMSDDDALE